MIFLWFFLFFGFLSYGAQEVHGPQEIPLGVIFTQVINFLPFFFLLVYFLKKPIKEFFQKRKEDFLELEKKAKKLEVERKKDYEFHKQKLEDMAQQEKTIAERAKEEGERYRKKKTEELNELKARFERERHFLIQLEEERVRRGVLQVLKQSIVKGAESRLLKETLSKDFHKKIQVDFLRKVKEVS